MTDITQLAIRDDVLFAGKLATSTTIFVEVPIRDGALGAMIAWPDAVSSATITLELTSNRTVSLYAVGGAMDWKDSGVAITGPAAAAGGAFLLNVENVRQQRARLKVVTAAVTYLDIRDGTG